MAPFLSAFVACNGVPVPGIGMAGLGATTPTLFSVIDDAGPGDDCDADPTVDLAWTVPATEEGPAVGYAAASALLSER